MNYWLIKQEPSAYSWQDFVKDGETAWTGVRNYQARNHLRNMKKGDRVLFYHSVTEKSVIGIAKVSKEAYPDPTTSDDRWSCVDVVPVKALARPVSLEEIKTDESLSSIPLLKQSRLSVMPLTAIEFEKIVKKSTQKA